MQNIFNKNEGFKKMKYITSKYILFGLKENKIKSIILSIRLLDIIKLIIILLIQKVINFSKIKKKSNFP